MNMHRTTEEAILARLTNAELVAELERRATSSPVLARCPECTREDALVAVHCADHGINHFPLRPREEHLLKTALRPLLERARDLGIDVEELADQQEEERVNRAQLAAFHAMCSALDGHLHQRRSGATKEEMVDYCRANIRVVDSVSELTWREMSKLLDALSQRLAPFEDRP